MVVPFFNQIDQVYVNAINATDMLESSNDHFVDAAVEVEDDTTTHSDQTTEASDAAEVKATIVENVPERNLCVTAVTAVNAAVDWINTDYSVSSITNFDTTTKSTVIQLIVLLLLMVGNIHKSLFRMLKQSIHLFLQYI